MSLDQGKRKNFVWSSMGLVFGPDATWSHHIFMTGTNKATKKKVLGKNAHTSYKHIVQSDKYVFRNVEPLLLKSA